MCVYNMSLPHRPLHIAAKSGLGKVVQELVQRGADLNARDCDGQFVNGSYEGLRTRVV